jgi:hypothetical protein
MKRFTLLSVIIFLIILNFHCFAGGSTEQKYPKIMYKINGVQKEYYNGSTMSYDFDWWIDPDFDTRVSMSIPLKGNGLYTYGSNIISFSFPGDFTGDQYNATTGFTINVTDWIPGHNADEVRGTFSGNDSNGTSTKVITDGTFIGWYYSY